MENHLLEIRAFRFGLRTCFGSQDRIFNSHPSDEENSKQLRSWAKKNSVSLEWVEEMCLGYLFRWKCSNEHIDKQMNKIHKFFEKGLETNDDYNDKKMLDVWSEIRD